MAIAELHLGTCRACGDPVDPCDFGTFWSEHRDLCRGCAACLEEPARCAHCGADIEREAEDVCDDCGGLIHDRCVHTGRVGCAAWHRAEEQAEAI